MNLVREVAECNHVDKKIDFFFAFFSAFLLIQFLDQERHFACKKIRDVSGKWELIVTNFFKEHDRFWPKNSSFIPLTFTDRDFLENVPIKKYFFFDRGPLLSLLAITCPLLSHHCPNFEFNYFLTNLSFFQDRDSWADLRVELVKIGNQEALTKVDEALFLLCLDDLRSTDPERQMQSLLCGDDGRNRW